MSALPGRRRGKKDPPTLEEEFETKVVEPIADTKRGLRSKKIDGGELVSHVALALFEKRCEQKGPSFELYIFCGRRLLEVGEPKAAKRYYEKALACDDMKLKAAAAFGVTECEVMMTRRMDPDTRFPRTAQGLLESARSAQKVTAEILALPPKVHEEYASILLQGATLLHSIAEPLANFGGTFARHGAEFLLWGASMLDAVVSLATVEYLPLRSRFFSLAAQACEAAGRAQAMDVVIDTMADSVRKLRLTEEVQIPVPLDIATKLANAETDVKVLRFRSLARTDVSLDEIRKGDDIGRVTQLLNEAGLDEEHDARARAVYEAIHPAADRGLQRGLDLTEEDDDRLGRNRVLALACVDLALPTNEPEEEEPTRLLGVPELVALARQLFALRESAAFQRVADAAQQGLSETELVDGAGAAFSRELAALRALDEFLQWSDDEARESAASAAVAADDAKKLAREKKKEAKARRKSKEPDDEGPSVEDLEKEAVELASEAERLAEIAAQTATEAMSVPTRKNLPVKRTQALIDVLKTVTGDDLAWRPDAWTDTAIFVWRRVCEPLEGLLEDRQAVDKLSGDVTSSVEKKGITIVGAADVKIAALTLDDFLEMYVASAGAVYSILTRLDVDDALLRGRVALGMADALRNRASKTEKMSDCRRAVTVLRKGLDAVHDARSLAVRALVHRPVEEADLVYVARQSITTNVSDCAVAAATKGRLGAHGYGGSGIFGAGSVLDSLHQALAALDVDLLIALARTELDLGRYRSKRFDFHQRRIERIETQKRQAFLKAKTSLEKQKQKSRETLISTATGTSSSKDGEAVGDSRGLKDVESRLLAQVRKHAAARAIVKTVAAVDRSDGDECLVEALTLLDAAGAREHAILENQVANWGDCKSFHLATPTPLSTSTPPAPRIIDRCATAMTLQPRAWKMLLTATQKKTMNEVDHLRAYGKPAGAGTDVTVTNTDLVGLGIPIPYDRETGTADCVAVTGLTPNESYVFAVAAFDIQGRLLAVGATSPAIEALTPLPLPICYGFLARTARDLGSEMVSCAAASRVYHLFVDVDHSSGHLLRRNVLDRAPLGEVYAFVRCATILAARPDNGGLRSAFLTHFLEPPNKLRASSRKKKKTGQLAVLGADGDLDDELVAGPAQLVQYTKVQTLLCAVEGASSLAAQDPEILLDTVWQAYHALVPFLKLRAAHAKEKLVLRSLVGLHQALWLVPPVQWDAPMKRIFSAVAHHLVLAGSFANEIPATRSAMLQIAVTSEGAKVVPKSQQVAAAGKPPKTTEQPPEEEDDEEEDDVRPEWWPTEKEKVAEQEALVEAWSATGLKLGRLRRCAGLPLSKTTPLIAVALKDPSEAWSQRRRAIGDDETPATAQSQVALKDAARVARIALNASPQDVIQWLQTALVAVESVSTMPRHVLNMETLAEATAAAEVSALATDDAPARARETALAVVKARLPYIQKMPEEDEEVQEEEEDEEEDEKTQEEPLAMEAVPNDVERAQLLWLAEIEMLLGLSRMADLANDRWRRFENEEETTVLAALECLVTSPDGPRTEVTEAVLFVTPAFDESEAIDERKIDDKDRGDYSEADTVAALAEDSARAAMKADAKSSQEEEEPVEKDVAQRVMEVTRHLSRAATRARWGRHWRQLASATSHLWNVLTFLWLSPLAYSVERGLDPTPVVRTVDAVLDFFDLLHSGTALATVGNDAFVLDASGAPPQPIQIVVEAPPQDSEDGSIGRMDDDDEEEDEEMGIAPGLVDKVLADVGIDREWIAELTIFAIRSLACARKWDAVVQLARRMTKNAVLKLPSVGGGLGTQYLRDAHVLAKYAQQQIITRASKRSQRAERAQAKVEDMLEEATKARIAKLRGRQARLKGGEKSPEEISLEAKKNDVALLAAKLRANHQVADHLAVVLANDFEAFNSALKASPAALLDTCRSTQLETKALVASYRRAEKVIRDTRDPLLLAQALQDRGDLLFRDGQVTNATTSWHEAVDGLFSSLDAAVRWRQVMDPHSANEQDDSLLDDDDESAGRLLAYPEIVCYGSFPMQPTPHETPAAGAALLRNLGVMACLVGASLVGKIARYGCRSDLDAKLERAKFGAVLTKAAFGSTLPHPVVELTRTGGQKTLRGRDASFALYRPSNLLARPLNAFGSPRRLGLKATTEALYTCAATLVDYDLAIKALPLCCLLEHVAFKYQADVRAAARARILRLQALARAGLVADAASVLASLLTGSGLPSLPGLLTMDKAAAQEEDDDDETTVVPFYGLPPLNQAVPPSQNLEALAWIAAEPKEDEAGAQKQTKKPPQEPDPEPLEWSLLTPEQKACFPRDDVEGPGGCALSRALPRGAGGVTLKLAGCYGATNLRDLALARCELLLQLGRTAFVTTDITVRSATASAATIAAELQDALLDAVSRTEKEKISRSDGSVVARCLDVRARAAEASGNNAEARFHAAAGLALLAKHTDLGASESSVLEYTASGGDAAEDSEMDAGTWLGFRWILARCALQDGRIDDAQRHCETGLKEAVQVKAGVFARRFEGLRCAAAARDGAEDVLSEVNALLAAHRNADARDFDYAMALGLAASLRRDAALAARTAKDAAFHLAAAQGLLVAADDVLTNHALDLGWIGLNGDSGDDVPAPSPLVNLYLPPVRWLPELRLAVVENFWDVAAALDALPESVDIQRHLGTVLATDDVTGNSLRRTALAKAESALNAARHTALTSPSVRGRLLLAVGRCRRFDVEAQTAALQGEEDKKKRTALEEARDEALDAAKAALEAALEVAFDAGHDHAVMRDAALDLVQLYGKQHTPGSEGKHLIAATHYLQLAGRLQLAGEKLLQTTTTLKVQKVDAALLTPVDLASMGLSSDDDVDVASLVRCLVALRGEAVSPGGFLDATPGRARDLAAKLHDVLTTFDAYRPCCIPRDDLAVSDDDDDVPNASVCAQWVPASSSSLGGNYDEIYPLVEAYVLLGRTSERFTESPHLLKVNASKVTEVMAMRRRVTGLRSALRRENEDLNHRFERLLCDVHVFLNPETPNAAVKNGELLDSSGEPLALLCDVETLSALETFFDVDRGASTRHEGLCFFFRDLWSTPCDP